MSSTNHYYNQWYLVFSDSDDKNLRFLKKGYRHVKAIRQQCNKEVYVAIEPYRAYSEVMIFSAEPYDSIIDLCDEIFPDYNKIVSVEQIIDTTCYNSTIEYNSCVATVKRLLGIKAWYIQTPYQLYKYLQVEE